MLERNLAGAYAKLVEGISEGCTLAVSQDFFSLISSNNEILETTRKVRAILTPDEGKRWLIRGRIEHSVEDGRSGAREFETTFDPTDFNEGGVDPEVPWDSVVGVGWNAVRLAVNPFYQPKGAEFYTDRATSYFDYRLEFYYSREGAELYSYIGSSEMFGHEAIRYEHRFPSPFFLDAPAGTETLFVLEFARDDPLLVRDSGYQGPVDGGLGLMEMNAVTEFGIESC